MEGEASFVQRARVADLFRQGGTVYVRGDGRHMAGLCARPVRVHQEASGANDSDAQRWGDVIEHEHVSDVFA